MELSSSRKGCSSKTPFLQLAKLRKFERIEEILIVSEASDLASWLEDYSLAQEQRKAGLQAFRGDTSMLHLVMEYKPPATLVSALILRLRELKPGGFVPEDSTDQLGRTPLHMAVVYGCDVSVIDCLLNGVVTVSPAHTKDSSGRLPLHWACANPGGRNNSSTHLIPRCGSRSKISDNMAQIIEKLLKVYPRAVTVRDKSGMTPLNLAIQNGAGHCIILMLDQAHRKFQNQDGYADSTGNSATAALTETDIPMEIFGGPNFFVTPNDCPAENVPREDCDDDMSSVGTGGVSCYVRKKSRRRSSRKKKARRPIHIIQETIAI